MKTIYHSQPIDSASPEKDCNTPGRQVYQRKNYFSAILFSTVLFLFSSVMPLQSNSQVTRGATDGEIFLFCRAYMNSNGWIMGLYRSPDNGEHLSLQHYFSYPYQGNCYGDSYNGVVYQVQDSVLEKSEDYGLTWNTQFAKPHGDNIATGNMPGEMYVNGRIGSSYNLYRTSDFGSSWGIVTPSFSLMNYSLLDVGSQPGEIYALKYGTSPDTLEIKYSNNYGNSYTSIYIDTSIMMNNLIGGYFTHGPNEGEFYFLRLNNQGSFCVFYTTDNGKTFEQKGTTTPCWDCVVYNTFSVTAGRTPGSLYTIRQDLLDSVGTGIGSWMCIDYSADYGQTFTSYCYWLDSLFTGTKNLIAVEKKYSISCAPNPVTVQTEIAFSIPAAGDVVIAILDIESRSVAEIPCGRKAAGPGSVSWNGRGGAGNRLSPGVYLLALKVNGATVTTTKAVVIN